MSLVIAEELEVEEQGAFAELLGSGIEGFVTPSRLSFSSISTYGECGELWRLTRGYRRAGDAAWWANPGGSAVHTVTEVYDKKHTFGSDEEVPTFLEAFEAEVATYVEKGVTLKASGTKGMNELGWRGGPDGKDRAWWELYGPQLVEAYTSWRERQTHMTIIAIELPFELVIGGERMVGHIDRVEVNNNDGTIAVRDLKTGKEPVGAVQLAIYREAVRGSLGVEADWGDFIMFNSGKEEQPLLNEAGEPVVFTRGKNKGVAKTHMVETGTYCFGGSYTDFAGYTTEYVEYLIRSTRAGIEAGHFMPNTRNNCRSCPVQKFCRAAGGAEGLLFPVNSLLVSGVSGAI